MEETMCNYLSKRGSTYYFRRKTPLDLIEHYGKEIVFSLKTKDRNEATSLCRREAVRFDNEFQALRATKTAHPIPTHQEKVFLAPAATTEPLDKNQAIWTRATKLQRARSALPTDSEKRRKTTLLKLRFEELQSYLASGIWPHDEYDPAPTIEDAEIAYHAYNYVINNISPPIFPTVPNPSITAKSINEISNTNHLGWDDLINQWNVERTPTPRTLQIVRNIIGQFESITGKSNILLVKKSDVINFKNTLLENKKTPITTNNYLTHLNTILNFAVYQDHIQDNPAAKVRIVTNNKRAREVRLPFDVAALNKIFGSPIYTHKNIPKGGKGEAGYWIPLLALFTGARLEEISQLRTGDIRKESYASANREVFEECWIMHITDEGEGQRLKTPTSKRKVPLHQKLLDLGFIDYCNSIHKDDFIFPLLKPSKAFNQRGANWAKWFSRYLRTSLEITDEKLVFHSFRHSFKHYARSSGIPKEINDAITGHRSGDIADDYGDIYYPLGPLVNAIKEFNVHLLDIKLPFSA